MSRPVSTFIWNRSLLSREGRRELEQMEESLFQILLTLSLVKQLPTLPTPWIDYLTFGTGSLLPNLVVRTPTHFPSCLILLFSLSHLILKCVLQSILSIISVAGSLGAEELFVTLIAVKFVTPLFTIESNMKPVFYPSAGKEPVALRTNSKNSLRHMPPAWLFFCVLLSGKW